MNFKSLWKLLATGILALNLVGCTSGTQQTGETGQEQAGRESEKQAPAEETVKVNVPAGTAVSIRLATAIDTGKTAQGSAFEGTLAGPLVVGGTEVAAVGSSVAGKVTHVASSGRLSRPAELSLVLTSLTPKGGEKVEIATQAWSMKGESHKKRNITMIGGGAGAGAIVGAITGGKKGAAIGSAIGAGAGTGVAAATGKDEIQLAPETKLDFKLSAPVSLSVKKKAA